MPFSTDKCKSFIQNLPDALFLEDFEGNILDVNEQACQLLGYEKDELLDMEVADLVPEDAPAFLPDQIGEAMSSESPLETINVRKDGTEIPVELRGSMIEVEGEERMLISVRDVTERRQTEKKHRIVTEGVSQAIYLFQDGEFKFVNESFENLSGYSKEELNDIDFLQLVHPDYRERVAEWTRQALSGDDSDLPKKVEYKALTKDDETIWVRTLPSLIEFEGRPAIVGNAVDITEEKELEKELRSEKNLLDSIMTLTPDLVYFQDDQRRFERVNKGFTELLDLDEEEIIGKTIEDFWPEAKTEESMEDERRVLSGEPVIDRERRAPLPDGEKRWYSINKLPRRDADGNVTGILGMDRDITERKEAEAELEKSESKFRAIAEQVHDGLFIHSEDKLEWVNERASEVLGYSKEELYGKSIWDLLHPEDRDRIKGIGERRVEGKEVPSTYEARLLTKDGEVKHGEFAVTLIEYNGKQAFLGAARDVTDRKRAEEKLKESEEKYRTIFESAQDAIFIMKGDKFVDCNEKTLEMFECEREDIVGQPPYDFSPEKQPEGKASAEKAKEKINLALEGDPQNFEWVHTTKDGEPFPAEVTLNRYMIEDEKFVMAIVRDITERKSSERKLKQSQERLELALEGTEAGIWDWNVQTGDMVFNERWAEIVGYPLEELQPVSIETWEELTHPEDLKRAKKLLEKHFNGETDFYECEIRMKHKNGDWVWVQSRGRVVEWNEEKDPARMVGTHRDITDRKEAEAELEKSEAKFRAIAEQVHDGLFIRSGDKFEWVNKRMTEILGYSKEELYGKSIWDLIHPEDRNKVKEIAKKREAGKEVPSIYAIRVLTKDGEVRDAKLAISTIEYKGEQATLGSAKDITERKEAQRKVEQRAKHERLLRQQSARFLKYQKGELDTAIEDGLTEIGEFLDVDRTYLFQFDWEREVMSNTHEWCCEGIEPQKDNLQDIPNSSLPAWMDKLQNLEDIHIPSIPDLPESWEAEREILEAQDIQSLVVVPVSYNRNLLGFAGFDAVREQREWNSEEMDLLRVFGDLTGSALHLSETEEELQEEQEQLRQSFIELAETTSRVLGVRDPYTQKHEQRVAELAREVGERMGLDEEALLGLYIGGTLHDIGKIAVPANILSKPGELEDIEWELIKSHPKVGYDRILEDTDFPWPVAEMTLHHHERLDGSGYPHGLEGDKLTTEVRILGGVDVVEAMSTRRPYRDPRSKERTLKVIKDGKGNKFDPEVVDILVEMIEEGEIEFGNK